MIEELAQLLNVGLKLSHYRVYGHLRTAGEREFDVGGGRPEKDLRSWRR
ncbi:MAG: hypothetical protein MI741_21905 [Rhodospirillales bacterium]|nr:hypothetical protein [Rhodospirillales bacterium]